MCPLLGLAPGGVYHASPVTSAAVGSYPTLSPLPSGRSLRAVYFLWHFPSAHAGRLLAVALSTWSPDFPPVWGYPHTSGCPAIWSGGGYRGFGGAAQMGGAGGFALRAPSPPIAAQWPATGVCSANAFPPQPLPEGEGLGVHLKRIAKPLSREVGGEGLGPETQEGTNPLRTSCLPVCFESVYRDTVLALDFGLRSTSGSGDNPFERITLHHPPDPDVRLFRRTLPFPSPPCATGGLQACG